MADITWPFGDLPDIDYATDREANVLRTVMESGRTRARRRTTKDIELVNARWTLTDLSYEAFKGFVYHQLESGSKWFNITLLLGGGETEVEARFVSDYSSSYQDHLAWVIDAQLELRDPHQLDAATMATLQELGWDFSELTSILQTLNIDADSLHEVVHVTLPSI